MNFEIFYRNVFKEDYLNDLNDKAEPIKDSNSLLNTFNFQ